MGVLADTTGLVHELPDEILQQIFRQVEPHWRLGQVCKRWARVSSVHIERRARVPPSPTPNQGRLSGSNRDGRFQRRFTKAQVTSCYSGAPRGFKVTFEDVTLRPCLLLKLVAATTNKRARREKGAVNATAPAAAIAKLNKVKRKLGKKSRKISEYLGWASPLSGSSNLGGPSFSCRSLRTLSEWSAPWDEGHLDAGQARE